MFLFDFVLPVRFYRYLARALYRCFLDDKMGPVLKVVYNLFGLILTFKQSVLTLDLNELIEAFGAPRHRSSLFDPPRSRSREAAFGECQHTAAQFRVNANFLFNILSRLGQKQPGMLHQLQLRLDFNDFFAKGLKF